MSDHEPTMRQDPRRKSRRALFALLSVGFVSLIGIVSAAVLLVQKERLVLDPETGWPRLQDPPIYIQEKGHELTGHRYLYDELLGWKNIPNWRATTRGKPLSINSKGLRGGEVAWDKPAGTRRILVLGDSYAWGYGVGDNEVFTSVLERQLNASDGRWQVINTGVSGWGTDQEYLYLMDRGFRFEPDIVVLAFSINDIMNNCFSRQYAQFKPYFTTLDLDLANVPVPTPDAEKTLYNTQAQPVDLTVALISAINEQCRRRNCDLVIVKFGMFVRGPDSGMHRYEQKLEELIAQALPETPFLDLDDKYLELDISNEDLLAGNDDGHWNAYGHEVTANLLLEKLIESKLVPQRTGQVQE